MWLYLNGLEQSLTAKSIHTVKQSCLAVYPTDHSLMLHFGMISRRSRMMGEIGQPSTSSSEAFPARISVLQDMEKAWKESEAAYFSRSCAFPKKSNPSSYFLKTCQPSQQEADFKSLERLPKWGMIVGGVLYPLQALERYTGEKGFSYWLTPSTMEHLPVREGQALENALYRGKNRISKRKVSGRLNEQVAYPHMWPTPAARDWKDTGDEPSAQARKSPCLPAAVKMYATLTASQANKPIRNPSPSRQNGTHGEDLQDSIGRLNPSSIGKKLCVRWTSVLMGYNSKWTDLKALETQSCPSKLEKLFKSCQD